MPTIDIFTTEKGLPAPNGRRRRPRGRISDMLRSKRVLLVLGLVTIMCLMSFANGGTRHGYPSPAVGKDDGGVARPNVHNNGPVHGTVDGFEREAHAGDDEDLMAEDDLRVENEVEKTPDQLKQEQDAAAEQEHDNERARKDQLQSLIYWLANDGEFANEFKVPDAADMEKMGAKGFQTVLDKQPRVPDPNKPRRKAAANADDDDEDTTPSTGSIFLEGWQKEANIHQRVTVFSKSFCPWSRRAKEILSHYTIVPVPYIVELDWRDDMSTIQSLLQYLTGRRTVPNVIVDFVSLGGSDEVALLHGEGGLARRVLNINQLPHHP